MLYGLRKKWGIELPKKGKDIRDFIVLSPDLARLGGRIRYPCRKTDRELLVTIPPNMRAGQQLRLKGMGAAGRAGGEAGDLYVTAYISPPPLIQKAKDLIAAIWSSVRSRC